MAWIVRDKGLGLLIFEKEPVWSEELFIWQPCTYDDCFIELPTDADERLIGRHLSYKDDPVEI